MTLPTTSKKEPSVVTRDYRLYLSEPNKNPKKYNKANGFGVR